MSEPQNIERTFRFSYFDEKIEQIVDIFIPNHFIFIKENSRKVFDLLIDHKSDFKNFHCTPNKLSVNFLSENLLELLLFN